MNILLAVDKTDSAQAAVRAVIAQFGGQPHHVRLFHVTDWEAHLPIALQFAEGPEAAHAVLDFEDRLAHDARQFLDGLAATLRTAGFIVTIDVRSEDDIKHAILDAAASWPANLIMMASHGRTGIDRYLTGVSDRVLHGATCPVEIVRDGESPPGSPA